MLFNVLIICFIFLCNTGFADNTAKLNNIVNQITEVKNDLVENKRKHVFTEQQIINLRKRINILGNRLNITNKKLKNCKVIIENLNKDQFSYRIKLNLAQKKLISQMNSAYKIEKSNLIKNIFTSDNKITSEQLLNYHKYFFISYLEQMQNIKITIKKLEKNKQQMNLQLTNLKKLELQQEQQKVELEASKQEYQQALSYLHLKIVKQNSKLNQLILAKTNLEKLIDKLSKNKINSFVQEKSKICRNFIWPVNSGIIITHFGSFIEHSSWRWNGIIIKIIGKQKIVSISSGRVIYSGWLTGYGLLLIIDHGNGYMSLYGNNTRLMKKTNSIVNAGEVISIFEGNEKDNQNLYFAIRYNGKPVDPEKWCK